MHLSATTSLCCWASKLCSQVCDPSKVLTVMLYDNCDKCGPQQVNLQALPFKQLAPLDIGRIGIQFREVRGGACGLKGMLLALASSVARMLCLL